MKALEQLTGAKVLRQESKRFPGSILFNNGDESQGRLPSGESDEWGISSCEIWKQTRQASLTPILQKRGPQWKETQ